jgi:hypothetical protein
MPVFFNNDISIPARGRRINPNSIGCDVIVFDLDSDSGPTQCSSSANDENATIGSRLLYLNAVGLQLTSQLLWSKSRPNINARRLEIQSRSISACAAGESGDQQTD